MNDFTIAYIGLLKVFAAVAEEEVCSLDPGNDICKTNNCDNGKQARREKTSDGRHCGDGGDGTGKYGVQRNEEDGGK
jgi:hypothetical protein